ncbi:retrovirus-related pol polyprotein from transposon TNT 1-94 [Tanacetum coccineum]|uniref:Retrovirus-related pol polyprotein from transposon TNT 1-94 n=1 Tax=Tanacetum coccineum TaxID=301880 RepID=A0ABQ4XXD6_9ASTR
MDFRSTQCVFLGYNPSHHGYRCLDISTERLYIARHVRFNEAQFSFDIPNTTSPPPSKTSPYYSSESPYVIPTPDHSSPSSPCSPISSPSSVSHLSPTSQTSPRSSNGQPSPISTTSIPTPPPPPFASLGNILYIFVKIPNNGFPTILPQIMLPSSPLPSLKQPRLSLPTTLQSGFKL